MASTRRYNRNQQESIRKRLRRDAPLAERLLWAKLQNGQLDGLKFRRQYSVDQYVVDFYCPAARLAVEIDGETHFNPEAERRDAMRQQHIESLGIKFIRFTNLDVERNMVMVIDEIWRAATERIAIVQPAAGAKGHPPRRAGARRSPLGKGGGSL